MSDEIVPLLCPKCRQQLTQLAEEQDLYRLVTCSKCGRINHYGELIFESGKTIVEHAKALAVEAFSGIKGFKPSR